MSLPFLHCHSRLSCLLMTLKHLHRSHSCRDLRLPLIPFVSLLRKQQGQAIEVEFPQCDLQDRQSWYQTCRTTVSKSSEIPTFGSLPAPISGTISLLFWCIFTTYSSLPWKHNSDDQITALKRHSTYWKEKDQKNPCNNKRGHMLVWFSLRSPGLGKKK